jgi:hypothetical protein
MALRHPAGGLFVSKNGFYSTEALYKIIKILVAKMGGIQYNVQCIK